MADDELKILLKKLNQAVNETLSESTKVNVALQNLRDAGYEVFLIMEVAIRSSKRQAEAAEAADKKFKLRLTSEDAKFLKSLKISVDDHMIE